MINVLVDGVFFQLASSGIARLWSSVLKGLISKNVFSIFILDRGGLPSFPGATIIPFPAYKDRYTADDSFLLQKMCDFLQIDVFMSTYYTSPVSTPMLLLVYDFIPELLKFDLTQRFWKEKEIAICFARQIIAISEQTKEDLLRFYPEIPALDVAVVHLGVDHTIFQKQSDDKILDYRRKIDFIRPYFLLVGSREQHKGYKNTRLFFEAVREIDNRHMDILCIGGEENIEEETLKMLPAGSRIKRLIASDEELALAYGGAVALVYPSLYEGFGLPVVEAMASGCPVITTRNGSLKEIVGEACVIVDAGSTSQMIAALREVQRDDVREACIAKGIDQAARFDWEKIVGVIGDHINKIISETESGLHEEFLRKWRVLRGYQANVDTQTL